ncbi:hypothetical protein [Amycolatopsis sp. WGS_07]|uniref:hypothetical protein n=1 Tax=Amycolatopsis sp. WGS_07 TaxID=3076764 RepID=UPI00387320DA
MSTESALREEAAPDRTLLAWFGAKQGLGAFLAAGTVVSFVAGCFAGGPALSAVFGGMLFVMYGALLWPIAAAVGAVAALWGPEENAEGRVWLSVSALTLGYPVFLLSLVL